MRFFRFASFPDRYAFLRYLFLALVSGSISLSSCKDDVERPPSSPRISFTSEISSSWTFFPRSTTDTGSHTRSTSDVDTPQSTVTLLQGGSTPLYLHTLYTDSIATPSSDDRPDTAVPTHPDTDMLTRSIPVTNTNMYNSFGVSAYSYTGSWSESKTPDYFYNIAAVKSGGSYALSSGYHWPGASYKIKFFAYAPKENGQYVLSGSTYAGSPTVSVTIPSNVDEQKDLLVAKTKDLNGNTDTAVPLTFHHALTAVRFECGNDMQGGTVRSVGLKNVCSEGTYNMGTQSWSEISTPATFAQTLNKVTTGTAGEALTTDAQTFMMVPQTLPSGALLEVAFTDKSGTDHTLTADIKGTRWPMGKTVTYKISSNSINWEYTLNVSPLADFTYTGGTQSYSVTCYCQNGKGEKKTVGWTTQYSENNGTSWTDSRPDWLTAFTTSGAGGSTAQPYNATVSAQTCTDNSVHTVALRNTPVKGSETVPYNLANQTNGGPTIENTANCYVVNAPGHYSFPLVYGNAIKDGATNSSAYTSTVAASPYILSTFINHAGNAITDPYIRRNAGCTPAKAELVWQDAPDLVTDINYHPTGDGHISFTVNKNTIRQGNAVIAIKDASGNILWSWHIWVTDEDISHTIEVTNDQHHSYKFMTVNIGWCDTHTLTYAERSCKVRFTAGDRSREITIKQAAQSITTGDNHPYYQWGRKDPFPPSNGLGNVNKTRYDKDGASSTANPVIEDLTTGIDCIKNYILKPDVMHSKFSGNKPYQNLWSADNYSTDAANDNPVIKTVYDPSPVGFKLPPVDAFRGFTTTKGKYTNKLAEINGTWDNSLKGWSFYTDSSKKKTIFFPAVSGFRNYKGGELKSVGSLGLCWSAIPFSHQHGYCPTFSSSYVNLLNAPGRGSGMGVRPILSVYRH